MHLLVRCFAEIWTRFQPFTRWKQAPNNYQQLFSEQKTKRILEVAPNRIAESEVKCLTLTPHWPYSGQSSHLLVYQPRPAKQHPFKERNCMKNSCHFNRFCKFYSPEAHLVVFNSTYTSKYNCATHVRLGIHVLSRLPIIPQRSIWAMSIEQWQVKRLWWRVTLTNANCSLKESVLSMMLGL